MNKKTEFNQIIITDNRIVSAGKCLSFLWSEDFGESIYKNKKESLTFVIDNIEDSLIEQAIKLSFNIWAAKQDVEPIFQDDYSPYIKKIVNLDEEDLDKLFWEKKLKGSEFFKGVGNFNFESKLKSGILFESGIKDFNYLFSRNKPLFKDENITNLKRFIFKKSPLCETKEVVDSIRYIVDVIEKMKIVSFQEFVNKENSLMLYREFVDVFEKEVKNLEQRNSYDFNSLWEALEKINNNFLIEIKRSLKENGELFYFDAYNKFLISVKNVVDIFGDRFANGVLLEENFNGFISIIEDFNLFPLDNLDVCKTNGSVLNYYNTLSVNMKMFDFHNIKRKNNSNLNLLSSTLKVVLDKALKCENKELFAYDAISHKISIDKKYITFFFENKKSINDEDFKHMCSQVMDSILLRDLTSNGIQEDFEKIQSAYEMKVDLKNSNGYNSNKTRIKKF